MKEIPFGGTCREEGIDLAEGIPPAKVSNDKGLKKEITLHEKLASLSLGRGVRQNKRCFLSKQSFSIVSHTAYVL